MVFNVNAGKRYGLTVNESELEVPGKDSSAYSVVFTRALAFPFPMAARLSDGFLFFAFNDTSSS